VAHFLQPLIDIDKEIEMQEMARDGIIQLIEENNAPVKKEDIVVINDYSFRGKNMIVTKIRLSDTYRFKTYGWIITGMVLKKDGTAGERVGKTYIDIEEK